MKTNAYIKKHTLLLALLINVFCLPAHSQVDFNYGKNNRGIRVGAGIGLVTLATHFDKNPIKPVVIGSLDYDLNPYLSFGFEGQSGTLQGIDDLGHLPYSSSTNKYVTMNFNIRAAVGLIHNFGTENAFQDALKRVYIGAGAGIIQSKILLVDANNQAIKPFETPPPPKNYNTYSFNFGTNIDLPGVLGLDRLSINPNYQLTFINSMYADGFRSNSISTLKGFYNLTYIKLKYKF